MGAIGDTHPALSPPAPGGRVEALTPRQLQAWPEAIRVCIIDVREDWEIAIARLPGAEHLPLGDLPAHLHTLVPDTATVLVCHHGVRSAAAAEYLRGQGFGRVFNLTGGIDAWAIKVDPDMRRY